MISTGTLAKDIVSKLSAAPILADVRFVVAYDNLIKPTPMSKPFVAISVKGCEVGPRLEYPMEGGGIFISTARKASFTIGGDIFVPFSMDGSIIHDVFDRLSTFFMLTASYDIVSVKCSEAEYDNNYEAVILRAQFVFEEVLSPDEPGSSGELVPTEEASTS